MSRLDEAVASALEEEEDDDDLAPVTDIRESAEDAPVIKLVNSIIGQAVAEGVSDIHLEPDGRDMRVRFRVDGVLKETTTIPRRMVAGVVSRIKIMGDLDIAEKRVPQDGRVGLTVEKRPVDVRIVSMPSVHGEGIVMRLLDKGQSLLDLDTLGMQGDSRDRFEAGFHRAHGAVLVTGPTGSGKSTTLYAALSAVNSVDKNIITIEDPVEYQLAGINQMQVNMKSGLTFARGLRSMLRADPDIIMVGEIRDAETARIAIESALTGHLVLSTLHTNDAPSAITPPDRDGHRALPVGLGARLCRGPAAGAHAVRALSQAHHDRADGARDRRVRRRRGHRCFRAGRLQPLRWQWLQGPARPVRGHAPIRGDPRR